MFQEAENTNNKFRCTSLHCWLSVGQILHWPPLNEMLRVLREVGNSPLWTQKPSYTAACSVVIAGGYSNLGQNVWTASPSTSSWGRKKKLAFKMWFLGKSHYAPHKSHQSSCGCWIYFSTTQDWHLLTACSQLQSYTHHKRINSSLQARYHRTLSPSCTLLKTEKTQ